MGRIIQPIGDRIIIPKRKRKASHKMWMGLEDHFPTPPTYPRLSKKSILSPGSSGGSASSSGATILWSQDFEGFENPNIPTGFATIAGVPDYWHHGPGSMAPGGGTHCLQINPAGVAEVARYTHTENVSKSYTRFYIYVDTNSTNGTRAIGCRDTSFRFTWSVNMGTAGPTLDLGVFDNNALTVKDSYTCSDDQWYRIEILYDKGAAYWEWKIGGTTEGSGGLIGTLSDGFYDLSFGWDVATFTVYYDLIALSNDDWIGA